MTEEFLALVAQHSGMVFAPNRLLEAEAGIERGRRRAGAADLAAYLARVRHDTAAVDALCDELLVGETHFMRDPDQLALLQRVVLPALRERRRAGGAPVRAWSAGCATGEEAYSLAILLEEQELDQGAFVLGTDLSSAALEKARVASYPGWSMRGASERFMRDYFQLSGGRRVLVDRIRAKVRFERLNFVGEEEYAAKGAWRMDLILCRNVLIYFSREAAGRIAARLHDCLAEGGVLVTGGADPLLGEYAPFEVEVTRAGLVYRRRSDASAANRESIAVGEPSRASANPPEALISAVPTAAPGSTPAQPATPAMPAPPVHSDLAQEAFVRVTAHANAKGAFEAERIAQAALRRHPLDAHLHYLRATLLLALDRAEEAEEEAGRALYLDPSLAVAHFLLGTILRRQGARQDALRSFRNVREVCGARPADEELPAGAGERTAALDAAAAAEMARLEENVG
jgi:chemotaxis protein methyltransferase CheR